MTGVGMMGSLMAFVITSAEGDEVFPQVKEMSIATSVKPGVR